MEVASYFNEDMVEETHWWFRGRRGLFGRVMDGILVPRDARILDAGTSSGSNLRLLRHRGFTDYRGLEISADAIAICEKKGLGPIERGDICAMPFADGTFDFVLATDIIEHIERDDLALREIRRVLKPGGYSLITVPAFQSLWGPQDVLLHHKRRYRQTPFLRQIAAAGLTPVTSYHFNFLLFLPILIVRSITRSMKRPPQSEIRMTPPWLDKLLYGVFSLDLALAPVLKPGFGVSLLVLCRREH